MPPPILYKRISEWDHTNIDLISQMRILTDCSIITESQALPEIVLSSFH